MNKEFKNEFKNLNAEEIKNIVNGCAGRDILETNFKDTIKANNNDTLYNIIYVDNEDYGFWVVDWNFKRFKNEIFGGYGNFEYRIKIYPFKIEFENSQSPFNPFEQLRPKQQLKDYLHIYINKKCPHYKQTIREETEKFIRQLDILNTNNDDELSK